MDEKTASKILKGEIILTNNIIKRWGIIMLAIKKYKELSKIIILQPQNISKQNQSNLIKLAKEALYAKVEDNITENMNYMEGKNYSSVEEYLEGKKWIDKVLSQIKDEWNYIQKIAWIDYNIGNKVIFAPEEGTEVENYIDERVIMKYERAFIARAYAKYEKDIEQESNLRQEKERN